MDSPFVFDLALRPECEASSMPFVLFVGVFGMGPRWGGAGRVVVAFCRTFGRELLLVEECLK